MRRRKRPSICGLGLVAFDHVTDSTGKRLHSQAGGTCGNVLTILGSLGWHSSPIARLRQDPVGRLVRSDLQRFGVDTSWIGLKPEVPTPVIIQKLLRDSAGIPFHCFSFYCPGCGGRLPRFQPIPINALREIVEHAKTFDVVFIDRISPSAFILAEEAFNSGALVFFEPSTSVTKRELERILQFTHVLKYSHERMHEVISDDQDTLCLELQTLGRGGLRFRHRSRKTGMLEAWNHMNSYPLESLADSSGAGDWLSAGLIHLLSGDGRAQAKLLRLDDVTETLARAQRLAAWSCQFIGARGAMYYAPLDEIRRVLFDMKATMPVMRDSPSNTVDNALTCDICALTKQSQRSPFRMDVLPRLH